MREILFRGKCIDNGEWVYGFYYKDAQGRSWILSGNDAGDFGIYEGDEVIPETLGQFTGLLDKNGVKIFEGDIITFWNIQCKGIIEWDEEDLQFKVKYDGVYKNSLSWQNKNSKIEVIGNIHNK